MRKPLGDGRLASAPIPACISLRGRVQPVVMTQTRLSIGDFSRMTYVSVKVLRLYHEMGLLVPAALGYQARQPHQEDVFTSSTDALRGVTSVRYRYQLSGPHWVGSRDVLTVV
jgi:hypothetical protein